MYGFCLQAQKKIFFFLFFSFTEKTVEINVF